MSLAVGAEVTQKQTPLLLKAGQDPTATNSPNS
jgi:hypothetical protein